jgi:hypothetical protein
MTDQLEQQLDPRAIKLWQTEGLLRALFFGALVVVGLGGPALFSSRGPLLLVLAIALAALHGILSTLVIPKLRYRYFRYAIRQHELELQRGVWVIKRTLVPLVRVQHVDTRQGPLGRMFGLSSVTVSTAASTHEIPALGDDVAGALRDHISALARSARDAL